MNILVFDIETANEFSEVGSNKSEDLTLSLVGAHDSATGEYSSYLEADLPQLWKVIEHTDLLVGYNSDHFDIPLLNKYYPGDLTKIRSVDLMKEIQDVLGRRLRLDAVAEGTLNTKKSGHGLQAIQWWRAGEIEKIRQYCLKDVEITKRIFDYALEHGGIRYRELGKTHEVKLDTSLWLNASSQAALTHTLGF